MRAWLLAAVLGVFACGPSEEAPPAPEPAAPTAVTREAAPEVPPSPPPQGEPANGLAALRPLVGRYPHEVELWDREPLAERLRALLGERTETLLANMDVTGPLSEENGVLYVTGNKAHQGGTDAAAVVIDPRQDLIWVWLLVAGEPVALAERDAEIALPEDVRVTIENAEGAPEADLEP
jgi:hypothetical protein